MGNMEIKYIDLILHRCLNFINSNSLLIHCDFKEHVPFAEKVAKRAKELGVNDICINVNDLDDIHTYLKITDVEEIELNSLIDRTKWDEYARKNGAILFLNSTVPGLMDDIEPEKIQKWVEIRGKTTEYYRDNVGKYTFPWCIVELPNERWAKSIFGNIDNAYNELYLTIMKMCMVDRDDPVLAWKEYIRQSNYYKNKLNELGIKSLHYKNSLGTDFYIELPKNIEWSNLDKNDINGNPMIANMPSYEIFTTPDCRSANGIVYSSKPLLYNDYRIEDFSLKFENGKVVDCRAKRGQNILEDYIYNNANADRLGEVALVSHNSPISNTGIVFNSTLFDENASCHLALGSGFLNCFPNSKSLTKEELIALGYNDCSMHLDFMIGTSDLDIEAETNKGKILIFKNGNFNI